MGWVRKIAEFVEIQKILFVAPLALAGALFSNKTLLSFYQIVWIMLAVLGAWALGLGYKKIIDLKIDSLNSRKKQHNLIPESISLTGAWLIVSGGFIIFILSAACLNLLCLKLTILAVLIMAIYPFIKRFHFTEHFVIGVIYGFACVGGWFAASGHFYWQLILLFLGVVFWIAGLSMIANLEDLDFYKTHHLWSIGTHFGRQATYRISRICQWAALASLILFGLFYGMGPVYWTGLVILSVLFFIIHRLYLEDDRILPPEIFFKAADWMSVLFLFFAFMETFR